MLRGHNMSKDFKDYDQWKTASPYDDEDDDMEEENVKAVPFVAIGNEELGDELGETIKCPQCFKEHTVDNGTVKDKETGKQVPSKLLQFYTCGDTTYLIGINGKRYK